MDNDDDKSLGLVNGIPDFILKLYKMLMGTSGQEVAWADAGTSFIIIDIAEFTKNLLPIHFKHGNFASFVRQLNKYDFHKVKTDDSKKCGTQAWEFSHSNFIKGQPQLLSQIKRKTATKIEKQSHSPIESLGFQSKSTAEVEALKSQFKYLENLQSEMSSHMKSLSLQYQQILDQMLDLRHTVSNQEQVIRSLIEYIPNDKKQFLNQALSNSLNARIFPPISGIQGQNPPVNLDSIMDSLLKQFEMNQSKNSLNISFKSVPDPLGLTSKPLDLTSKPPSISTQQISNSTPKWSAPPKVLLVEDDDTCRRLSSKLLQNFGCNFDIAVDGLDAVNRMNIGYKYDLVLMDIMMPNLDGVSATTRIRQFDQFTPIISMTSNITENDCMTYLANGMNDILAKPFNKSTLLGMIKRHCADRSGVSSTISDRGTRITEVAADKEMNSQLMGLMRKENDVTPPFISQAPSFVISRKRVRLVDDEESEAL